MRQSIAHRAGAAQAPASCTNGRSCRRRRWAPAKRNGRARSPSPTNAPDYRNEKITKTLNKYLHTKKDVRVEDRMRACNLIRDLTADGYSGWELVTTIAAGGGLAAQRIVTMGGYDLEGAKDQARLAAGIMN